MTRLNPPDRIITNIHRASDRMLLVDEILGDERLLHFAEAVSDLLIHIDSCGAGLARLAAIDKTGAIVCAYIVNAATEYETAWNMLRLANVPGTLRQSRVGCELVAGATVLALPSTYLRRLSASNLIALALKRFPGASLEDLLKPTLREGKSGPEYVPAPMRATQVFRGFTMFLSDTGVVDQPEIEMLQRYREDVQHPASHGSRDLMAYHFEGFGQNAPLRGGAYCDPARHDTYRRAADDLVQLIRIMHSIALRVAMYVRERC